MRLALAFALVLVLPALAGCLHDGETPPPTNVGNGNGNGGSQNGDTPKPGKHLDLTIEGLPLSEGKPATLVIENVGDVTLNGVLTVDLVDPANLTIARTPAAGQSSNPVKLDPRGVLRFTWTLPSKLEGGLYRWNVTLDGATATGAATVGGSAFPGEGPLPLGVDPPSLSVSTEKTTYERDEPITIALKNTGGYPARGRVNVTIHGPATALPSGSTHTAPEVAAASLSNILINPDATLTLDEMTIPLSAIPAGTPQFYVFVEWARGGRAVTNLFVDNTSSRPTPIPGILQRSFTAGPEYSWDGNRTITVPGAAGNHPFKIYFHFATSADVTAGHAPATLVPTTAYVDEIAAAFTTSWTKYKNDGFALPQIPIHAYVDNPGGEALGTFQPAAYGGHIIIGPKSLHDDKSADVRTTVAHELFHAFQTSYDYDEGLIIEGIATWIMDTPFGTKDYIGQSRAYINNPDAKPLRYQEHELVLFVRWLRDTHGFAKMKELTEKSADYDNEALLAHVFGKSFDELWVDFVKDLARRHVAGASAGVPGDAAELFDKPGVFGLKAWRWYWQDKTAVLSWDIANRTLDLPISNFNPEMVDEDVGQVKHAYGIDVFALTNDATDATDNLRVKFTSRDPGTTFTVILATKGEAATSWSLQTLTAGTFAPISDLTHNQALLFITRGEGGTGEYELEMRKP